MSSVGDITKEAAGQERAVSVLQLDGLPVETLIEILCNLDFETLDSMLLVSRQLNGVVEAHCCSILPAIIEREFSPAEGFLGVLQDVFLPEKAGSPPCGTASSIGTHSLPTLLRATRLRRVLNLCRAIKRWETEFPRLRFCKMSEHSRSLRPHELCRLRHGLYVWWRFARCFHGPEPCPDDNDFEPRRAFMRRCSTAQLREVHDMWVAVRSGVRRHVCPSISVVRGSRGKAATKEEAARIGWGHTSENRDILDTMMKLSPDHILHLLVYRHRYATKRSVIQFVKLRHPRIEDSIQTFTTAITAVFCERAVVSSSRFLRLGFGRYGGGILDHEDPETEELRSIYSRDAGFILHDTPHWIADLEQQSIAGRVGRLWPNT